MTPIDSYIEQVRRRLGGMDPAVQQDILRELRSHLVEATEAGGGDVTAIAGFEDPVAVARGYRDLYGYGLAYRVLFAALAGVVGVLSIPALFATEQTIFPLMLSVVFLLVEVGLLMWISVVAGNRAGLVAGAAGCAGRLVAFGGAFLANGAASMATSEGLAGFVAVSILLVVIGWLPGRAKQVWRKPGAEL